MNLFFNIVCLTAFLSFSQICFGQEDLPLTHFNAAACCVRGPDCYEKHARLSIECKKDTWMVQQSKKCQDMACEFCTKHKKRYMCQTYPILWNCFKQDPPYSPAPLEWSITVPSQPAPTFASTSASASVSTSVLISSSSSDSPSPSPSPSFSQAVSPSTSPTPVSTSTPFSVPSNHAEKNCTFHSTNGLINIAARTFPLNGLWTRTSGAESVIWRRNGGAGTYKPDDKQAFCVRYKSDQNGLHYFTTVSSAPHGTEHNDAWFKFSAKTILYRPKDSSVKRKRQNTWMKGFQNHGPPSRADYILTIDKNGHQIFLDGLQTDKIYRICVGGRSTQFEIFNLVVFHCNSLEECNRSRTWIRKKMEALPDYARCAPSASNF